MKSGAADMLVAVIRDVSQKVNAAAQEIRRALQPRDGLVGHLRGGGSERPITRCQGNPSLAISVNTDGQPIGDCRARSKTAGGKRDESTAEPKIDAKIPC